MTVVEVGAPAVSCDVSVAVVDVSRLFAESLAHALAAAGLAAQSVNSDADIVPYDVVLADARLPADQLSLLSAAVGQTEGCRLVLLSQHVTKATCQMVRETRASAHVARSADVTELVMTVRSVAAGREIALPRQGAADGGAEALTQRELQVVELIARGATNEVVARELGISPHTVRSHLGNILSKLGVTGRLSAVAAVRRAGLLKRPAVTPIGRT